MVWAFDFTMRNARSIVPQQLTVLRRLSWMRINRVTEASNDYLRHDKSKDWRCLELRNRPSLAERIAEIHLQILEAHRSSSLAVLPGWSWYFMIRTQEKRFAFDKAFDAETGNQRLFEATTQPLIGRGLQTHRSTEVYAFSPHSLQSSTFNRNLLLIPAEYQLSLPLLK